MAPRSRSKPSATAQPAAAQPAPVQRAPVQHAPVQHAPVQPPVLPAPVQEEYIDIDNVSNASEDEDEDEDEDAPAKVSAKVPAKARATPASGANVPGDETTKVAPIIKPVVKSNRALDIDLLFVREKGKPSVCKYCKSVFYLALHQTIRLISFIEKHMIQTLKIFQQVFGGAMNRLLEPPAYESISRTSIWDFTSSSAQNIKSSPRKASSRKCLLTKHQLSPQFGSPLTRRRCFVTSVILLLLTIR